MRTHGRDGGQTVPLVAVALVVLALVAVLVADVGRKASDQAQARTAADAAALAGVRGSRPEAQAIAVANRATLTGYVETDEDVLVTVRVGDAQASARARLSLIDGPP
ncbi:MAG: Helicase [Acidimicrobiia bacterium]|nr:Helicase [Acidimicrobiia bacterium]